MNARAELLHSNVYLLFQDQKRVTDLFADWTASETVQRCNSVTSVLTSVLRHLQRDLDRIFVLRQAYSVPAVPEAGSADGSEGNETTNGTVPLPPRSVEDGTSPPPSLAGILLGGYRALGELESRYESAYCVATALDERPLANVARYSLEDLRGRQKELIGLWPHVMTHRRDAPFHASGDARGRSPRPRRR